MFYVTVLPAIALAACAASTNQEGLPMDRNIECTLEGEALAGAEAGEVCNAFREVLAEADLGDVARVELVALSETEAKARVIDSRGAVRVELGHAIMDRTMSLPSWRNFAKGVAKVLRN